MHSPELHKAIEQTKALIHQLKQQIEQTTDLKERRQLKELQYLQLWHLDQLG